MKTRNAWMIMFTGGLMLAGCVSTQPKMTQVNDVNIEIERSPKVWVSRGFVGEQDGELVVSGIVECQHLSSGSARTGCVDVEVLGPDSKMLARKCVQITPRFHSRRSRQTMRFSTSFDLPVEPGMTVRLHRHDDMNGLCDCRS